jgi:hypothetical protein
MYQLRRHIRNNHPGACMTEPITPYALHMLTPCAVVNPTTQNTSIQERIAGEK